MWCGADSWRDVRNHLGYCNDSHSLAGGSVEQPWQAAAADFRQQSGASKKKKVIDWWHTFTQRVIRKVTHMFEVFFCHLQNHFVWEDEPSVFSKVTFVLLRQKELFPCKNILNDQSLLAAFVMGYVAFCIQSFGHIHPLSGQNTTRKVS